jgi:hypothetical protein
MRSPALFRALPAATLLLVSPPDVRSQVPESSEMQDRATRVILTRAVPLMEQAARAGDWNREQAAAVELLLQEQRRTLSLFLGFSGLSGEALESKLQDVLNSTNSQLESRRQADTP